MISQLDKSVVLFFENLTESAFTFTRAEKESLQNSIKVVKKAQDALQGQRLSLNQFPTNIPG